MATTLTQTQNKIRQAWQVLKRLESGNANSLQFLIYAWIMVIMIAFLFDLSQLAVGITRGRSVLNTIAQETGKDIDPSFFAENQYVVLEDGALARAAFRADQLSQGSVSVNSLRLAGAANSPTLKIEGSVRVKTPSLSALFGINGYAINMSVTAGPAWGIEREGS